MNIEKLLRSLGEMQEMLQPDDKLTETINRTKKSVNQELQEDELEFVWAARGTLKIPDDIK